MPIPHDQVVTVQYILKDADGNLLDSTYEDEAMEFITGSGEILAKLEAEIVSMPLKSKKMIVLRPEDAFGDYDPEDIEVVHRHELPDDIELEIGAELLAATENEEEEISCFISKIEDNKITLDFNHPLAGKSLYYEVELTGVRPATEEELEHGHVHGQDDYEE